jgi:DNA-binding transcriptional regulator YiaG
LNFGPALSIVAPMPDVGSLLKSEIRRLAKKEARFAAAHAQRRVAQHRRDIAKLRRIIQDQATRIARLEAAGRRPAVADAKTGDLPDGARFSPRSVKAQRSRLGLSAALFGKLVGVSGQTVYSWEHSHSRPRPTQMAAWFASRSLSKQEALERIGHASARRRTKNRGSTKALKRRRRK